MTESPPPVTVVVVRAEGVSVRAYPYTLQHKLALYHEAEIG